MLSPGLWKNGLVYSGEDTLFHVLEKGKKNTVD